MNKTWYKTTYFLFSISIFALILLIVILALIYNFLKQESISPEQILPKNAHIILYFNSLSKVEDIDSKWAMENTKFDRLIQNNIQTFLTTIKGDDYLKNKLSECYVALFQENNNYNMCFLTPINKSDRKKILSQIDKQYPTIEKYKDFAIYQKKINGNSIYFYYYQGVLCFSTTKSIIRLSINDLNIDKIEYNHQHIGKSSREIVYISKDFFSMLIQLSFVEQKHCYILDLLTHIANKKIKVESYPNILFFNGIIDVKNAIHQQNISKFVAYQDIIPANVGELFFANENMYSLLKKSSNIGKESIYLMQNIYPQSFICVTLCNERKKHTYLLCESRNIESVENELFLLTEKDSLFNNNSIVYFDTFFIKDFQVGRINIENFVAKTWNINRNISRFQVYTLLDDKFLFAENDSDIIFYINSLQNKLSSNTYFQKTISYFSPNSDICYYHQGKNNSVIRMQLENNKDSSAFFNLFFMSNN